MRTYHKINGVWTEIDTDINGFNDSVYFYTLVQSLKLSIGESPFFANYGIPAQQSVITQVHPDFYVAQMQSLFAAFFASLQISKVVGTSNPTYKIDIITHQGAKIATQVSGQL